MTPLVAGIVVAFVAFAVSVPGIGWLIRNKQRRIVAGAIAAVISIALGVVVARLLQDDAGTSVEATEGGTVTP